MLDQTKTHINAAPSSPGSGRLAGTVLKHILRVVKAIDDRRQLRQLISMSDHDLKDVGVTRNDVDRELMKPIHFW